MEQHNKTPLEIEAENLQEKNLEMARKFRDERNVENLFRLYEKALLNNAALMRSMMMFSDKEVLALLRGSGSAASGDVAAVKEVALEAISLAKAVIASVEGGK